MPLRIASGARDPFRPGVLQFTRRLGPDAVLDLPSAGCHDATFFTSEQQRSLQFVGRHITA